jgi:hypothetical protein
VPKAQAEEVLSLYRDKYFDLNVRHFHEKLGEEQSPGCGVWKPEGREFPLRRSRGQRHALTIKCGYRLSKDLVDRIHIEYLCSE